MLNPNKLSLARAPCNVEINPPPIIIIINKLEAVLVFSFKPAIPKVKIHGQSVLQKAHSNKGKNTNNPVSKKTY